MKRNRVRLVSSILLAGVAVLVILPACGGASSDTAPTPTVPQTTATATATPAPTATPTVAPAPTSSAGHSSSDPLTLGKEIFEKTAGTVGCAYCHGMDAKGGGISGEGAPDIRGVIKTQIRGALAGGVPLMGFIKLNEEELSAVAAYVEYLSK